MIAVMHSIEFDHPWILSNRLNYDRSLLTILEKVRYRVPWIIPDLQFFDIDFILIEMISITCGLSWCRHIRKSKWTVRLPTYCRFQYITIIKRIAANELINTLKIAKEHNLFLFICPSLYYFEKYHLESLNFILTRINKLIISNSKICLVSILNYDDGSQKLPDRIEENLILYHSWSICFNILKKFDDLEIDMRCC